MEIFYVVSVYMSGETMLEDQKSDDTGLIEIRVACFFCRKKPIKAISNKLTSVVTDSQFKYNVASDAGIKNMVGGLKLPIRTI